MLKCVENPLPSYFITQYFTFDVMENFDNADKNSLLRMKHTHDTALTVFQKKPLKPGNLNRPCPPLTYTV